MIPKKEKLSLMLLNQLNSQVSENSVDLVTFLPKSAGEKANLSKISKIREETEPKSGTRRELKVQTR